MRPRQYRCGALLSPTPDMDPEPLYRCTRAEHADAQHDWPSAPFWLPQRNRMPHPMKVVARATREAK